jgi:hypothetical protein
VQIFKKRGAEDPTLETILPIDDEDDDDGGGEMMLVKVVWYDKIFFL